MNKQIYLVVRSFNMQVLFATTSWFQAGRWIIKTGQREVYHLSKSVLVWDGYRY